MEAIDAGNLIWWFVGTVLLAAGGIWIAIIIGRRFFGGEKGKTSNFSLEELRKMQQKGQITEDEYKALRQKIVRGI